MDDDRDVEELKEAFANDTDDAANDTSDLPVTERNEDMPPPPTATASRSVSMSRGASDSSSFSAGAAAAAAAIAGGSGAPQRQESTRQVQMLKIRWQSRIHALLQAPSLPHRR